MRKFITLAAVTVGVAACNKPADTTTTAAAPEKVVATPDVKPKEVGPADWRAGLEAAYKDSKRETKKEGVTTFNACFDDTPRDDGKCETLLLGQRDAFRKLTHLTPFHSKIRRISPSNYVQTYIAIADCEMPAVFISPNYSSRDSWIFMNKVAALVDGELTLERDFSSVQSAVARDTFPGGVNEEYQFIATKDEFAGWLKVRDGKDVAIRLTGSKGYVSLDAQAIKDIRSDLATLHPALEKLTKALTGKIPPSCPLGAPDTRPVEAAATPAPVKARPKEKTANLEVPTAGLFESRP